MVELRSFFLVLFAGILMCVSLWMSGPPSGIFKESSDETRTILTKLPAEDHALAKLNHAAQNPRYDIGLFGNSRIIMVGQKQFLPGEGRVFNFAIGGQSFRNSVRMLKALNDMGRAPRVAIISFDYSELGLPGHDPITPGLAGRLYERSTDFLVAFPTNGFGLKDRLVFLNNAVADELLRLQSALNIEFLTSRLQLYLASWRLAASPENDSKENLKTLTSGPGKIADRSIGFLNDGSMPQTLPDKKLEHKEPPVQRRDRYPLLEVDFQTLKELTVSGIQVLIYESTLAPDIIETTEKNLSVNARFVRERMFRSCRSLKMKCFAAPSLNGQQQGVFWPDYHHAPATLLADWIRQLIGKHASPMHEG